MKKPGTIIADTSVWIEYFNRPASAPAERLTALIQAGSVMTAGIVIAELLQGCQSDREREETKDALLGLPYLEASRASWIQAGELSCRLRRAGLTIPLSDLLLATIALQHGCQVFTLDPHFEKIPDLQQYLLSESRGRD